MKKKIIINGQEILVTLNRLTHQEVSLSIEGITYNYLRMDTHTHPHEIVLKQSNTHHLFHWHGKRGVIDGQDVTVEEIFHAKSKKSSTEEDRDEMLSPMPGKILQIHVKKGDAVKKGQILAVMEAMKMEHTITSPRKGIISSVACRSGDRVEGGAVIIKLEKRT